MAQIINEDKEGLNLCFKTFSDRIFSVLELMNIKKTRFYTDLKISRTTVQNWKRNVMPAGDKLINIALYLDLDPSWLLTGMSSIKKTGPDSPVCQAFRIKERLQEIAHQNPENTDFYLPIKNIISPVLLTKWEYGMQIPKLKQLELIAEYLDMDLLYLLNGQGEKHPKHTFPLCFYDSLSDSYKKDIDSIINAFYIQTLYEESTLS